MNQTNTSNMANDYLDALLKGDRIQCSAIAKKYYAGNPSLMDLYEKVFKVALYEIGKLWENNKITVATEHIATAITEGILNEFFEHLYAKKKYNKKVVLACVENEKHQVGIKMVADVFEMNGWDSYFPGVGVSNHEILQYIQQVKPDLVSISLSVYFNYNNLIQLIEQIKKEFPQIGILVGGQALKQLTPETIQQLGNVVYITDLYFLEKFIESINTNN